MRKIKYIAVHCTAGNQAATVDDLRKEFARKGWKNPGYHYVITADGVIHQLLDNEKVSNGVRGYNAVTVNVAYTGGIDLATRKPLDNRTAAQKASLRAVLKVLHSLFPTAVIQGHRDFPGVSKACPSFDAKAEYADIQSI
jgi:N-acetylmuramoyl-L-alanine amidase